MSLERIVVVGAGQGGFQAAASLRQEGFAGRITLIGDEPFPPYQRPPLSKAFMKDGDAERLLLKPLGFYERSDITRLEGWVAAIDRAGREVVTSDGAAHPFDHLVLATGARNARPPLPGLEGAGTLGLRSLQDAMALRARMAVARSAVVIGGGFIGLEFAAVARSAGLEVTVLEAADRLMARVVSPEISATFLEAHRGWGSDIRLATPAVGLEPGLVRLADGSELAADLVLVATGVEPNVELARAAGLEVANGIVVCPALLTADPAVSALGDCAAFPLPDGRLVRLESVQAAVDHARHIARRLVHRDASPYRAVPWFWSDQGDRKLQIAGLAIDADRRQALPAEEPGRAVVLSFAGERLVAVETVNAPGPHMAARRLLAGPEPVTAAEIAAAGFDLVRLGRERPAPA